MQKVRGFVGKSGSYICSVLISLSLLLAACAPAGTPEAGTDNMGVDTPGSESSDLPLSAAPAYMKALNAALNACKNIGQDQVCFGQGMITVEPQPNVKLKEFAKPGDVLGLANIIGLQLGAAASENDWSVAVMHLQADLHDPEKYLTIVLMGETGIKDINVTPPADAAPFTFSSDDENTSPATPAVDVLMLEPLQRFKFTSQPFAEDAAPNGLLVWTPMDESASVILNGVIVTLGSTAFVQAQPGGQMTIAMLEGSVLATTADGEIGHAAAGTQVSIPLDEDGSAFAPVGEMEIKDPRAEAISHAVAQYKPETFDPRAEAISRAVAQYTPEVLDPRAEAISHAVSQYGVPVDPRSQIIDWAVSQYPLSVAQDIRARFHRAIDRCTDPTNPQPRYVYNVLYFYNLIHSTQDPEFLDAFRVVKLADLEADATRCLSFELDFDSKADFMSSKLSYTIHLRAEGVKVQFKPDGSLNLQDRQPLKHLTYEVIGAEVPCASELIYPDGTLTVNDGSLKINQNDLRLVLYLWPDVQQEKVHYACPYSPVDITLGWSPLFYFLHEDLVVEPNFEIKEWKTVESELFAEAIYERTQSMGEGTVTTTTFMDLVHTPQR